MSGIRQPTERLSRPIYDSTAHPLRIGTWNVRTLMDSAGSDRPQRRTTLVVRENSDSCTERDSGLGSQMFGRSKKLALYTPSSGVDTKVKRGVRHELALPLKRNLLVSFQDCQKASMTA